MSKAPPIPPEQRAFKGGKPDITGRDNPELDKDAKSADRSALARQTQHHQQDR